jgi:hypothetical protein
MTHNVQGLLLWRHSLNVQPQTAAYKDILFDVYYLCSSAFRLPELKPNSDY